MLQVHPELAGSIVVTTGDVHVWSGNIDENSQKTVEQLLTVNRWGSDADDYTYIIVGVATRDLSKLIFKLLGIDWLRICFNLVNVF